MNLFRLLQARASAGKPVRVGLIGAGKFGSMFLAQVPHTPGLEVPVIVDLDRDRAREACRTVGWTAERIARDALFTDDGARAIAGGAIDVVVEATGNPAAGIAHARAAIAAGKHIVMVNVEADVLAGPLLAEEARKAGVVYSLAYGDQPALTARWSTGRAPPASASSPPARARSTCRPITTSTPDDVWQHYGLTADEAQSAGMNPQMFNSFLDGTKSAIEMAAIANACGLDVPHGRACCFRPAASTICRTSCGRARAAACWSGRHGRGRLLARARRPAGVPRSALGRLCRARGAERLRRATASGEYGLKTDCSGRYAAMYKPYHLIGLELNISVLSAALRGEPTGQPRGFRGDVVAVAKRDLRAGEMLDGEGGYTVWGKLVPAAREPRPARCRSASRIASG